MSAVGVPSTPADADVRPGELVGLAFTPVGRDGAVLAVAWPGNQAPAAQFGDATALAQLVAEIDAWRRPRWVVWSQRTAADLLAAGTRLSVCWDLAAVHRLLHGGWRAEPGHVWAAAHDRPEPPPSRRGAPDLFSAPGSDVDPDQPVGPDGQLGAEWVAGEWAATPARAGRWAALAVDVAVRQQAQLEQRPGPERAAATARSESTAELLCAELAADGLPVRREVAEGLIADIVGPRPRSDREAEEQRAERDATVLRHAPAGTSFLLRNPAHVKSLLRTVGLEVDDTRAWRLESLRDAHPIVDDLLAWRKAERMVTTFGYGWLDQHVGPDDRLRGDWSAADGAAGRMTATAGLHNMPAELRPAVVADPGHRFVRADLGQIEPRVLAAVSGDRALIAATESDDLYLPVATALGVDRATAKVAVLGAMYGQTTGHGAAALRRLEAAFPVAMTFLRDQAAAGQGGRDIVTWGGRLVRMGGSLDADVDERDARGRAAARGRYARNAAIQGAAAELFKFWAVTVRVRGAPLGAQISLCLHDELLVHVPVDRIDDASSMVDDALAEAAHRWAPGSGVRFVADTAVVTRWSEIPR